MCKKLTGRSCDATLRFTVRGNKQEERNRNRKTEGRDMRYAAIECRENPWEMEPIYYYYIRMDGAKAKVKSAAIADK